ncbi:MAG: TetR/AcrR family transcriptional regulator [Desulfomonilaceae bacterium]|nr:TetR/AcrR family transcriptional regulator [Desulfomonilaceae bacterium]
MTEKNEFKSLDKSMRRRRIVDTAIRIFHEKGYRSATLDDVAKELGLTKAALYHYVASKRELLSIIYIQALESFFATMYEIGERDLTPPEKLRLLIRHHIKHIVIENLPMFGVFFSEENQLPDKDYQKIREEKRKFTLVVEKVIEAGIEQGYFRPVDGRIQAYAVIGMCNWLYRWYKPGKSSYGPDEIADHFIDLVEKGLVRVPGEEGSSVMRESMPRRRELIEQMKLESKILSDLIKDLERFV